MVSESTSPHPPTLLPGVPGRGEPEDAWDGQHPRILNFWKTFAKEGRGRYVIARSPITPSSASRASRSQDGCREGEGFPRFSLARRGLPWHVESLVGTGFLALERERGRCYTPAALKVAAALPSHPRRHANPALLHRPPVINGT